MPGALIYRAPWADRARRGALPFEERLFWAIVISVTVSSIAALSLAIAGAYTFGRLLAANCLVSTVAAATFGRRWRLENAARPTAWVVVPAALVALGLWLYVPTAEYVLGGKDPGTYMNEGIQIAQRGRLVVHDPVPAALPPATRELFFPSQNTDTHHSVRFMGFFLLNPDDGGVVGQFPHLFPAWIAIGYGLGGLTGARNIVAVWAILGLLATYFAGARLVGRVPAAVAAALLAVHVVTVWFARYPNSEVVMQALAFAGLLALARSWIDDDRFFAPVGGTLFALLLTVRIDAVLVSAAVAAALVLGSIAGRRVTAAFLLPFAGGSALAVLYLAVVMRPYMKRPLGFVADLHWSHWMALGAGGFVLLTAWVVARRPAIAARLRHAVPSALAASVVMAAGYALWFREPSRTVAASDALSLRMYATYYVTLPGLVAALLGFVLVVRRSFWRDPAFFLAAAFSAFFFFFKLRIVPDHFWAARRFVPIILPLTFLFASAAAFATAPAGWRDALRARRLAGLRPVVGLVFLALLGAQYWRAMQPIRHHVEYAGVIPKLEELAARFGDDDLVIVESRDAGSDLHVLALPLAYIYARNVLVLNSRVPDRTRLVEFLAWARSKYREVFFLGGGGTDLLSRTVAVEPVGGDRFQVPEYESLLDAYPRGVRRKEWDYGLYRFVTPREDAGTWFSLDVGARDDLLVVRFNAKERSGDLTFRWSRDLSYVTVLGMRPDWRTLTIWMGDGGRPAAADVAAPAVYLNDWKLGQPQVTGGLRPYTFAIPPEVAAAASAGENPPRLRLITNTWNPRIAIGAPDDRELGVMVDRVEVR